ncbi:histone-like nucleoid-structuring protein Lsr2 [[Kitasatospora] papulosa]|uniref:Lsr2 family DNA-binding protein n=1 Tax=[Kitasatospora] papulosa TaxID=1464011 RepID=UPI003718C9D8
MSDVDLEDVAAWCLRQKWLGMREDSEDFRERRFFPRLIEVYQRERPKELKREAEEASRRAEWDRIAVERRKAAERAAHQTWLMKDMREWGRKNGHFVGTRGRIPRKVIDAYKEAKGS